MTMKPSATADKFVLRMENDGLRKKVEDAAKAQRLSMNAFILNAIDNELGRGKRFDALLDHHENSLQK